MKKKILSAVLALAMVFGLFGGMQKDALAEPWGIVYFTEDNLNTLSTLLPSKGTGLQFLQQDVETTWIPGNIVKPGDPTESDFGFVFMDAPLTISLPMTTWEVEWGGEYEDEWDAIEDQIFEFFGSGDFYYTWTGQSEDPNYLNEVIPVPDGYDAWKIQALFDMDSYIFCLYPVQLTPPAPEVRDCELTSQNGITTWKDYYGKTVWTITEKEDAITADLTDWAAIPDAIVKAWKESGKAINLSYLWKGYSVSVSIPAGEIARTGAEWYGAEYIAKANEQYVTVKDWFGQTVSIDVLY